MNDWLYQSSWFDHDISYRLVVSLLHFIWQASILGGFAHLVTLALRKHKAQHAYGVNVAFLACLVLVAMFTFCLMDLPSSSLPSNSPIATPAAAVAQPSSSPVDAQATTSSPSPRTASTPTANRSFVSIEGVLSSWSRPIATCYVVAVGFMLLRVCRGVWRVHVLRHAAISIDRADLLQIAEQTAKRIGLAATPALRWCEQISTPIVVGLLKPVILLPAAIVGGLTTHQVEAILAHEMAHIRRFDLWVSLLQRIVECVFFFHPAVWLVSRRIDIEREIVADDVALQAGCDPTQYADSLLRMAELSAELRATLLSLTRAPAYPSDSALAAIGNRPSGLKSRVTRLLGRNASPATNARSTFPAIGATLVVTLLLITTALTVSGGLPMNNDSTDGPSQVLRDTFSAAIKAIDLQEVEKLLKSEPKLANADLREPEHRDVFSNGHPLHRACAQNHAELAQLLLEHGADPDAPGPNPDDRPVHGMPLHWAAAEHRNYQLANLLLDFGATPASYPNCDKATIERMFYQSREVGVSDAVVRRSFAKYLPDQGDLERQTTTNLVGVNAPEAIKLFARMVDLGGQPPFKALVREGFDELLFEIIEHCQDQDGTPHDHPNSNVLNNIAGAARWYGYPHLVRRLMEHPSYKYSYGDALETIGVAIGSHNRDGDYWKYREIIVMQLEALEANGDLEKARQDPEFKPIYQLGTDFTWHSNYGHRAAIADPECYIDLAELLVSWGFDDINHIDSKTKHSPLSAAVQRGHHPGIATYIQWLLEHGADVRESDPDEVNPLAIAKEKGLAEIQQILETHAS